MKTKTLLATMLAAVFCAQLAVSRWHGADGCGEQDPRIEYTRNIVKTMRDGGVEVRFNSYPGDHEWQVWRKSLHEFAQYLFK